MTEPITENNEEELELGDADIENSYPDGIYPLHRDDIQISVTQRAIFAIIQYLKKNKIILQPSFQRGYVRNDRQSQKLIDSIWNNLPIPQLFLLQNNEGELIVIDGQQRLTTILRFCCDEEDIHQITQDDAINKLEVPKELFDNKILGDESQKIQFSGLLPDQQTAFENQALSFTTIKISSKIDRDKSQEIAREIFHRLNTGGTNLTEQEIRLSIYNNAFTNKLKNIAQGEQRQELFPLRTKRFLNNPSLYSEILLRCLALLESFGNFEGKLACTYSKPYGRFFDQYAALTEFFVDRASGKINYEGEKRINAVEKVIQLLTSKSYSNVFKHEITGTVKNFNIKYIDTILIGLIHAYIKQPTGMNEDLLLQKAKEFKINQGIYTDIINKTGDSDTKHVEERVKKGIETFETKTTNE